LIAALTSLIAALTSLIGGEGGGGWSSRAGRALLDLVGLGPGATPSGDDVLVGLVAGLHGAGTPFAEAVLSWLRAEPAATWARTTPLSAHLLRDALDGDVADPLATFVSLLADPGASADALANARTAVLATGATSGADTCVGLALAGSLLIHPAPSLPFPEGSLA